MVASNACAYFEFTRANSTIVSEISLNTETKSILLKYLEDFHLSLICFSIILELFVTFYIQLGYLSLMYIKSRVDLG